MIKPLFQDQSRMMGRVRCVAVNENNIAVAGNLGNIMVFDREKE